MPRPNVPLRTRRERALSQIAPGEPMSRVELAEAVNRYLWESTGRRYQLDAHTIARYERGAVCWPSAHYRSGLRHVLGADRDAELGFHTTRRGNSHWVGNSGAPSASEEVIWPPTSAFDTNDDAVRPWELIDSLDSAGAERCVDAVEVRTIKRALGRYPTLASAAGDSGPSDARRVRQQLAYSGRAWLSSHFTTVARTLPDLLRDAQTHAGQARGPEIIPGYRMLVMAYRLACSMLLKYEATDVAWLAADRALNAAQAVDDDVALARATRSIARAMSQGGQRDEAITVCTGMADKLRPQLGRQDADTMPLYGMLLLAAEITASTHGDADLAAALHEDALTAANRLTFQHEGRACYLLDLADAHAQTASVEAAVHALCEAERLAPEEVLRRPTTHRRLARLLSSAPGGSSRTLRNIAQRAGVGA